MTVSAPPILTPELAARLKSIRGFVFDMDGTLILGDKKNNNMNTLPGAVEFLNLLHARQIPFVVMTNGTVRSARDYVGVLSSAGIPLPDERWMMTPSSVAADYFVSKGLKRIMVLGCPGVWQPLVDAGLEVVLSSVDNPGPVEAVYIGWYREFTFKDLEAAYIAVRDGASIYTASDVPFFATANGPAIGTSCAIAGALQPLTGIQAEVLGKPSQYALQAAAARLGLPVESLAVVGDDPGLEVPMALAGGATGIFVRSGTGNHESFAGMPAAAQPHLSLEVLGELIPLYEAATAG